MTKEEIAKKYVPCRCDTAYTSRGLTAPDCPYHSTDPEAAMDEWAGQLISSSQLITSEYQIPKRILDEYAKQQAIAFGFHVLGADPNDPEMGGMDAMSETYGLFIKQQSNNGLQDK
jgi:hypothetical protein